MAETLAVQLTRVQAAIATIEDGGQAVSRSGRNLTFANLQTLYERERQLLRRIANESRITRTVAEM